MAERSRVPRSIMRDIRLVGRDLYRLALVTSHGGNVSMAVKGGIWITGTGTMLGRLRPEDVAFAEQDGDFRGPMPSSDTALHQRIYAATGVRAVVHAHPRHAIALTFERDTFVPPDLEGELHLGDVPVVPPGPDQTEAIAASLLERRVVILRGHGAYAKGEDLWRALHWITALEESAHIAWLRARNQERVTPHA